MELVSEKEVMENFTQDVCTEPERASSNSDSNETNFTITEMDYIELSLEDEERYGLKTCLVELERCDKIWETIQLIRHLQDDPNLANCSESDENSTDETSLFPQLEPSTNDVEINNEETNNEEINPEESDSSQTTNTMMPYIKYQPVLNNGNAALPNFQFSVQRTRILYPCLTCGKQYSHTRSLREHSEKVHHIRLPPVRKKNENDIRSIVKSEPIDTEYLTENESSPIEPTTDSNGSQSSLDDEESSNTPVEVHFNFDNIPNSGLRIYSCPFCDKSYRDKYTLNKHLKKIHEKRLASTRTYKRKKSSMSSENSSSKIRRVKQSRSLDVHRCKTCGKHFYGARNIRQHCRKVHGIYVRPKTSSSDYHKSQNTVKSEKNSVQLTDSTHNIDVNITTNDDISIATSRRPIRRCPVCNKLYRDHLAWKNHCKKEHGVTIQFIGSFPTELGYNNFNCKICKKKFSKSREMIQHYKVAHHQRLRFKCETCKSLFNDAKSLTRHSSNVHKLILLLRRNANKFVTCKLCGVSCTNRSDLDFHKKEEHANERSPEKLKIQKSPEPSRLKTVTQRKQDKKENINLTTSSPNLENTNQLVKSPQYSENISDDTLYMTNCILCENRKFKHIRKHFMEYHKVRNPEALIAQCTKTLVEPVSTFNHNNVHNNVQDIKPNINNILDNSQSNKSQIIKWPNRRCVSADRFFMKISQPHERKLYACKYCPFSSNNYDAMRKDEKRHKREGITSKTKPLYDHVNNSVTNSSLSFIPNKKRKCESPDNRNARRRKVSLSLNEVRTTRASTKIKEEYFHICSLCGRTFRSTQILRSHKVSCIARLGQQSGSETSDTRASSDRDSGIGISITIKKKNDSYEIVNRDSNDDKFSSQIYLKKEQNNSSFDKSLNSSLITKTEQLNDSFEYSKNHKFVKIQQGEDSDVDIGSDLENQNDINNDKQENLLFDSVNENCNSELNNQKTEIVNKIYQVPSLKILCRKALVKRIEEKDKPTFKCKICSKVWPSLFSLFAHKKVHLRHRKRTHI